VNGITEGGFYRRNLPHFERWDRPLFVTFSTIDRRILPPAARTIVIRHCLHEHGQKIFVDVAVVMPDHVHLIFHLLQDPDGSPHALRQVMKSIKGVSARRINQFLARSGPLWQDESFDHVLREHERSRAKYEYVCENPVRAGLVRFADDYPWLWRSWIEGRSRPF
jgi:REP element-mobilizing transposase RayT